MKRKFKFTIPPRYVMAGIGVSCLVLMVVSFKFPDAVAPAKAMVGNVMTPMQKGINKVGNWIYSKKELMQTVESLLSENKKLKEDLDVVSQENNQLQQDKYELESLRQLYQLDQKYASYPTVGARVIGYDANNWYNSIKINKGTDDGIKKDMNVIAGNGLVGIVSEAHHNYSIVRLIVSDNSNVAASVTKTGDTCFVKGNLKQIENGLIDLQIQNKDAEINVDDEVVTSYTSSKFLPGILIGYVESVELDSTKMTKTGYLRPAVDFDNLDIVLVITEVKEQEY